MNIAPETAALLQQAAEWRLLSMLFECPSAEWRQQLVKLAAEVPDAALRKAACDAVGEAEEGMYHSIFGPGGPAPAREVSYHDNIQLGYLMSEVSSYYNAFQFAPRTEEAVDHVSIEAAFVAYLGLKQAFAVESGTTDAALVAAEAARRFIDDHLSCVAEPLAASLTESGVGYLAAAGKALLERVGPRRTLPVLVPALDKLDPDCEVTCN